MARLLIGPGGPTLRASRVVPVGKVMGTRPAPPAGAVIVAPLPFPVAGAQPATTGAGVARGRADEVRGRTAAGERVAGVKEGPA